MQQRYNALSQPAADRAGQIEAALAARRDFEAGQAKVNKWTDETEKEIYDPLDLECPLPKLNEIYIFYQGTNTVSLTGISRILWHHSAHVIITRNVCAQVWTRRLEIRRTLCGTCLAQRTLSHLS